MPHASAASASLATALVTHCAAASPSCATATAGIFSRLGSSAAARLLVCLCGVWCMAAADSLAPSAPDASSRALSAAATLPEWNQQAVPQTFSLPLPMGYLQWGTPQGDVGTCMALAPHAKHHVSAFVAGRTAGTLPGNTAAGDNDIALTRINTTDGSIMWQRQWGSAANDEPEAVAVGRNGSVAAVAGYTRGAMPGNAHIGGIDFALSSVDASGAARWHLQWGTATTDLARAVALTDDERVAIVAGETLGTLPGNARVGGRDFVLASVLMSNGSMLWQRQWGTNTNDEAAALVLTGNDTVALMAGRTFGTLPLNSRVGGFDFALASMRLSDGQLVWQRQWGSPAADEAHALALGVGDAVALLAGETAGTLTGGASAGGIDFALSCVNVSDGDLLWQRQWGTTVTDRAYAVAVVADGALAITAGSTTGTLPGNTRQGGMDFTLSCLFVADGQLVWQRQWGTSGNDEGLAVALHGGMGVAFVAGYTTGALPGTVPVAGADFALTLLANACPAGYRLGEGLDPYSCEACAHGSYSTVMNSEQCTPCSAGTFAPTNGSLSCTPCPAGHASSAGASSCAPCPRGTYALQLGGFGTIVACEPCAAGAFSDVMGASSAATCTLCPPGSWSSETGASACTACPAGTWSGAHGSPSASSCSSCPAGQFSEMVGASSASVCTPCPAGTWSASPGAQACTPCPPGTFRAELAADSPSSCTPCRSGSYAPSPASTACNPCPTDSLALQGTGHARLETACQHCAGSACHSDVLGSGVGAATSGFVITSVAVGAVAAAAQAAATMSTMAATTAAMAGGTVAGSGGMASTVGASVRCVAVAHTLAPAGSPSSLESRMRCRDSNCCSARSLSLCRGSLTFGTRHQT